MSQLRAGAARVVIAPTTGKWQWKEVHDDLYAKAVVVKSGDTTDCAREMRPDRDQTGSPFAQTLVASLANDSMSYIPTDKAFKEGSYETLVSLAEVGTALAIVASAGKLLNQLHTDH
ncbi:MAG: hypothetical protein MUQ26_07820 [Armatimonadetes bacterium]|nr:hypothetical protein [Armatimonadota bacterium]